MSGRAMARLLLLALLLATSAADQSDTDTASVSDTSGTSDIDTDLDNNDPNLHNPISRHGYGGSSDNNKASSPPPTMTPAQRLTTEPPKTLGQQTVRAALELGIVVGVCLMVGLGFMTMVGLELFIDKLIDEYRRILKKPAPLPDVERLHPAELVGKFSRYK